MPGPDKVTVACPRCGHGLALSWPARAEMDRMSAPVECPRCAGALAVRVLAIPMRFPCRPAARAARGIPRQCPDATPSGCTCSELGPIGATHQAECALTIAPDVARAGADAVGRIMLQTGPLDREMVRALAMREMTAAGIRGELAGVFWLALVAEWARRDRRANALALPFSGDRQR